VEEGGLIEALSSGAVDFATLGADSAATLAAGTNIKLVASVRSGCIQLLAKEGVGKAALAGGVVIGVSALDSPEAGAAAEAMAKASVSSYSFTAGSLDALAALLASGDIGLIAAWEGSEVPEGAVAVYKNSQGGVLAEQAMDMAPAAGGHSHAQGASHFAESYAAVNAQFLDSRPEEAERLLLDWLEAVNAVGKDPAKAASEAEKKGFLSQEEASLASQYMYVPTVKGAKENYRFIARSQAISGLVDIDSTNAFIEGIFADVLPEWN